MVLSVFGWLFIEAKIPSFIAWESLKSGDGRGQALAGASCNVKNQYIRGDYFARDCATASRWTEIELEPFELIAAHVWSILPTDEPRKVKSAAFGRQSLG